MNTASTTAGPAPGRVVAIENRPGKTPVVTQRDGVALDLVEQLEGQPNRGFHYGTLGQIDSAVNLYLGRIEPYGTIARHEGQSNYILYVTGGSGTLINVDAQGQECSRFAFRAGDAIFFKPRTMHHWEGGPDGCSFVGVEQRDAQPD